jgi:hypothetical protein
VGLFPCKIACFIEDALIISMESNGSYPEDQAAQDAMEQRIFRRMWIIVIIATLISAVVAPWRTTVGLLLGGMLSILNHHWLRTSLKQTFEAASTGASPRLGVLRYLLRYSVVASVIALSQLLNIASLVATLAGLCSFAVAALIEAFMQVYFAIVRREEG